MRVCVCVRESVSVCVCVWESERVCVCVCVWCRQSLTDRSSSQGGELRLSLVIPEIHRVYLSSNPRLFASPTFERLKQFSEDFSKSPPPPPPRILSFEEYSCRKEMSQWSHPVKLVSSESASWFIPGTLSGGACVRCSSDINTGPWVSVTQPPGAVARTDARRTTPCSPGSNWSWRQDLMQQANWLMGLHTTTQEDVSSPVGFSSGYLLEMNSVVNNGHRRNRWSCS